jgi:hypothetical protein
MVMYPDEYESDGETAGLDLEEALCPMCDSVSTVLGVLGRLVWFRCRGCGSEWAWQ